MILRDTEVQHFTEQEVFFRDTNVVITGGAAGIGEALARKLLRLGAKVTVVDVSPNIYLPEEITQVTADVTDPASLERVVVLEPMATTSTSAKIRRLQIGAAKKN